MPVEREGIKNDKLWIVNATVIARSPSESSEREGDPVSGTG